MILCRDTHTTTRLGSPVLSSAEAPSLRSDWYPTGRTERSAPDPSKSQDLGRLSPHLWILLSSHMSGSVGATSRLAPVVRASLASCTRGQRPPVRLARGHRELNRWATLRGRFGFWRGHPHVPLPTPETETGPRPRMGTGASMAVRENASSLRSDRPPQGRRERVGRGSLHDRPVSAPTSVPAQRAASPRSLLGSVTELASARSGGTGASLKRPSPSRGFTKRWGDD
jgi:hypothetical protein